MQYWNPLEGMWQEEPFSYGNKPYKSAMDAEEMRKVVAARVESARRRLKVVTKREDPKYAVVLTTKKILPPFIEAPTDIGADTIIPKSVSQPTAQMVSDRGHGKGKPWTYQPVALPAVAVAAGQALIYLGNQVVFAMAMAQVDQWIYEVRTSAYRRGYRIRFQTGQGFMKPGGGLKIRSPGTFGGAISEGTDPYEEPEDDDKKWYKNPFGWW